MRSPHDKRRPRTPGAAVAVLAGIALSNLKSTPMPFLALTPFLAGRFIAGCWIVYGIVWTVAMFSTKRTVEKWSDASRFGYLLSWVVSICLLNGRLQWGAPPLYSWSPTSLLLACALSAFGLAVAVWARLVLGRNWSGNVTLKEGHELVERGPYHFVRHPIYTGLLMMMLGGAIARGTPEGFLGVAIFLVAHIWKLRVEEALMRRNFPDAYAGYCARTKALVPGIY
jgi:protein-S-isoprenylcysteine O-methyltransferase Ste14